METKGDNLIALLKAVRTVTGCDLAEAKMLVEKLPSVIVTTDEREAESACQTLEEAGATAYVQAVHLDADDSAVVKLELPDETLVW